MSLEPYTSFGIFDVAGISLAKHGSGVTHYAVWASAEHNTYSRGTDNRRMMRDLLHDKLGLSPTSYIWPNAKEFLAKYGVEGFLLGSHLLIPGLRVSPAFYPQSR